MGPRLDSRGNHVGLRACGVGANALQWGRDLIVAETWRTHFTERFNAQALQWGRDLIVAETNLGFQKLDLEDFTSMGPRLDSRGNQLRSGQRRGRYALQWGRDLIVAETSVFAMSATG